MCGIIGIKSIYSRINKKEFIFSRDLMKHRGPDAYGIYDSVENNVMLGHRRLSIIDLSNEASQPMISFDGSLVITYNGELYNYKELRNILIKIGYTFKSNSDTEVILNSYHAWKENSLEKLNGMFSFCIYNTLDDSFFIVRDRLGIKPLFYFFDNKTFIFSSELKSILNFKNVEKIIDTKSILDYLSFGYIPAPKTSYQNIYKLLPGHFLIFKKNKIVKKKYWDIDFNLKSKLSYKESLIKVEELIEKSTASQLISDVPIGSLLSGGIDSSAVSFYASRKINNLISCSIGFDNNLYSETEYSKIVAKLINSEYYESIMSYESAFDDIDGIISMYDEPFADSSSIPTLEVSKLAKEKMTVALSGDGGDEIFSGYKRYSFLENRKNWPYLSIIKSLLPYFNSFMINKKGHRLYRYLTSRNDLERYFSLVDYFSPLEKRKIINNDFFIGYDDYSLINKYWNNKLDINKNIRYIELKTYLPDDILTKVDRASMKMSLEVRPPLLDHRLVEFCFSLPSEFHHKNHELKSILKDTLSPYFPPRIIKRNKKGFSVPWKIWKKKILKNSKDLILNGSIINSDLFNLNYLEKSINKFSGDKLWLLIVLEKWLSNK